MRWGIVGLAAKPVEGVPDRRVVDPDAQQIAAALEGRAQHRHVDVAQMHQEPVGRGAGIVGRLEARRAIVGLPVFVALVAVVGRADGAVEQMGGRRQAAFDPQIEVPVVGVVELGPDLELADPAGRLAARRHDLARAVGQLDLDGVGIGRQDRRLVVELDVILEGIAHQHAARGLPLEPDDEVGVLAGRRQAEGVPHRQPEPRVAQPLEMPPRVPILPSR